MTKQEAYEYRAKIETAAESQSDEQALESVELFPAWVVGKAVAVGERYRYEGVLYRVVQAHTTQNDWTPDITPALWTVVSVDEWPEWVQPIGASDAYMKDDHVSHNDKHWESLIDGNVWEPGAAGTENLWREV